MGDSIDLYRGMLTYFHTINAVRNDPIISPQQILVCVCDMTQSDKTCNQSNQTMKV